MSIFGKIKDAVFGNKAEARTAPSVNPASVAPDSVPAPAAAASAAVSDVDVAAQLDGMAATNGQKLNWRTSIVDLMKLVGMDSSLQERKDLAMELGYTGELTGSTEMNLWLHKTVLKELSANGGKVPADLMD